MPAIIEYGYDDKGEPVATVTDDGDDDELEPSRLTGTTPRPDAIKRLLAESEKQATALRRVRALASDLRAGLQAPQPFERFRTIQELDAILEEIAKVAP